MATKRRAPVDVPEPTRKGRDIAAKKAKKPAQKTIYKSAMGVARKRAEFPTDIKMADSLNIPYLLTDLVARDGENGTFYIMTLIDLTDQKRYRMLTGSMAICDVLSTLEKDDLPVTLEFEQRGRGYFIVEPEDQDDDDDDDDDDDNDDDDDDDLPF